MISDAAKQCIALINAIATGRGATPETTLDDLEAINTALQLPLESQQANVFWDKGNRGRIGVPS